MIRSSLLCGELRVEDSQLLTGILENISGNISVDISENIRGCNRSICDSSLCGELRVKDSQLLAVARAVNAVFTALRVCK